MDLWDIGRTVFQRWYFTLPLLVATVLLALFMSGRVNPEYSAETSLLLLAPSTADDSESPSTTAVFTPDTATDSIATDNPYLSFPSSLTTMAQATQLAVSSDASRSTVAEGGLLASYEVVAEDRSPLLFVRVSSTDERLTLDTMDRVVSLVEADLEARQNQVPVPANKRIEVEVLARSQVGSEDAGGRTQVRLTVIGLGVLLTIAVAVASDAYARRRRLRKSGAAVLDAEAFVGPDPSTDLNRGSSPPDNGQAQGGDSGVERLDELPARQAPS